ncbi:hypothetical protein BAU15_04900 [Enterococcus sp. JM4C]|uniref:hypothetical protein n=1 Tax=Candidatus Enterococcus huntleyi TaxID=1857217 RepID=UPI00137A3B14|nr:hypothetical protein [Enterococcus sp. JM4C]KAF1295096.1 hypothetical protein BAU15_04900 [Enterococcus sp. JM4C]
MTLKEMNLDDLSADANYLVGAIEGLQVITHYYTGVSTNESTERIEGVLMAIHCFAEKHASNIEAYGTNEGSE